MPIHFYKQVPGFNIPHSTVLKHWLKMVIIFEGGKEGKLDYIFCSDEELLKINKDYLKHDYYTDIITFDTSEENEKTISAELYISVDRVKENAAQYNVPFQQELYRVVVHGLLHLLGYKDKTKEEVAEIRAKEEHYLAMVNW